MTYRELMIKILKCPEVLDQSIVIYNEQDERFYGCTGHDVIAEDDIDAFDQCMDNGSLFLMVNI